MNKKAIYILPSILTAILLLFIFLIKSIYPFGHNTVMWADMYQINTPMYYYFYDIFYNHASLFYNFKSGLGMNFYGVFFFFLASPFSFIVLLFQRSDILYSMSILLLIKMMFIAFTSFLFFHKYFNKSHLFYKVIFSVLYAFSGYVLILYTNIMWLDPVYLFPLLLISLKNLYDNDKIIGYILVLTTNIIMCFYISYMVIFFIFFSSVPYLCFYVDKKYRGKKILLLGISTITSLLLSAIVIIPSFLQISNSSRIGGSLIQKLMTPSTFILDKISFFLMNGIVYALIILLFKKIKKDKHVKFLGSILLLTMIQVLFDSVNKLWHTGSYSFFPLRYGFIPLFFLMILGMYIISHYEIASKKMTNKYKVYLGILISLIIGLFFIFYKRITAVLVMMNFLKSPLDGIIVFLILVLFLILFVLCYLLILKNTKNLRNKFILLSFILFLELIINSCFYIGIGPIEMKNEYKQINAINNLLKDTNKTQYRAKDLLFDSNDSLIYDMFSNGHFTSLTDKQHMDLVKELGYSSYWMRSSDTGGTIFTDSLLSQKYVLVNHPLDQELYTLIKQVDANTFVYEANDTLPLGFLMSQQIPNLEATQVFDVQNEIYQDLMNTNQSLIQVYNQFDLTNLKLTSTGGLLNLEKVNTNEDAYASITINATDNEILYLDILRSVDNTVNQRIFKSFKLFLDGKPFDTSIPSDQYVLFHKKQLDENIFPQQLSNGLLELGRFSHPVTIKIEVLKNVTLSDFSIGALNISSFQSFVNTYEQHPVEIKMNGNTLSANINSTSDDKMLFLSIPYDKEWHLTINGVKQPVSKVMGDFMGIKLHEGNNTIQMTYTPHGIKTGLFVSLFTLIALLLSLIFYKKMRIHWENKQFFYIWKGFISLYILGILCIYIIPIILESSSYMINIYNFFHDLLLIFHLL